MCWSHIELNAKLVFWYYFCFISVYDLMAFQFWIAVFFYQYWQALILHWILTAHQIIGKSFGFVLINAAFANLWT